MVKKLMRTLKKSSKDHSMLYTMEASENLTGKKTTTIELCEAGLRTATTRSYPLGHRGDVITFNGRPQKYRITAVFQVHEENANDPIWVQNWSKREQWTIEHFYKVWGGKTVHKGSWQTCFQKINRPVQKELIS